MAFSINSNLTALKTYNALAKINARTHQSQLRLATGKRINSVSDDTSGFNIGKSLEAKAMIDKSKLKNADAALNYLSTAEASLVQITDMITQIQAKYVDSKDTAKDTAAIAKDIRSIATEIDSILKNTKFNDQNLLAQSDGSALASNAIFDISGDVTMDFASSSYLDVDSVSDVLTGGASSTPGIKSYTSATLPGDEILPASTDVELKITTMDGQEYSFAAFSSVHSAGLNTREDILTFITDEYNGGDIVFTRTQESVSPSLWNLKVEHVVNSLGGDDPDKYIKNIEVIDNTASFDLQQWLGIDSGDLSTEISGSGGLLASSDSDVLDQAGNLLETVNKVKSALGRIGNLTQQVQLRSDFLTSSIANSESSVSRLFDADMAIEQLNATKGNLAGQAATQLLAQANTNPQQILQLFR